MTAATLNDLAAQHLGRPQGDYREPCPICRKPGLDNAASITVEGDGHAVAICHRCHETGTAHPKNGAKHPAARFRPTAAQENYTALWAAGSEPSDACEHPYLTKKQVQAHGIRVAGETLLIPMRSAAGDLVGVQRIAADDSKRFTKGARTKAAYHVIGQPTDRICIAEGYATAASIFEATGIAVAVAFSASNLIDTGRALRVKYPTITIIIAADDDTAVRNNPGVTAATAAAKAIGGLLATPGFGADRPDHVSDFNDLACHLGPLAVTASIAAAKPVALDPVQADDGLEIIAAAADILLKGDKGVILACEHNACVLIGKAFQYDGLHYDDFLSRQRIDERDWIDADDLNAVRWLQSAHGVAKFNLGHARNAARSVAYSRRRDSLCEFVEALPAWDGTPRIEQAFTDVWGAADSALTRAASRNFFVALIARALRPGAQVDTVWVFEARQDAGKSRSLRTLGGAFHAEISAGIGTTDFQRELRGLWIAELSELDSLRGKEATTIKRLLSAPSDRFVQKYALHAESYPRRAVAVATTNEANYWADSTGARRLIPIKCGDILVDLIEVNRLQWFAEALHLYRTGSTWWQFGEGIADEQEARQQVDAWEDTLRGCMAHGQRVGLDGMGTVPWPSGWISSADIMREWLHLEPSQQGNTSGVRLGKIMRRLGYRPKRSPSGDERGWIPDTPETSQSEVSGQVSDGVPL